jgi:multiple antibiotic resistance protein
LSPACDPGAVRAGGQDERLFDSAGTCPNVPDCPSALWFGEPLLHVLGLSTAALAATGGTALILSSVPMMIGTHGARTSFGLEGVHDPDAWRSIVFMPITFPLTIGGATVGLLIGFRAEAHGMVAVAMLTVAALAYAAVTGLSIYMAGRIEPRLSDRGREMFDKLAGIMLTAIAFTLLASGVTRLVIDVLHDLKILLDGFRHAADVTGFRWKCAGPDQRERRRAGAARRAGQGRRGAPRRRLAAALL